MSAPSPPHDLSPVIKVSPGPLTAAVPLKLDAIDVDTSAPPALPPRPPPRPRPCLREISLQELNPGLQEALNNRVLRRSCWLRKYVFLCTACGGLATLLGALFLTVYFMLRSYTTSLNYFETVPTFIPAASLILTGLMVMSLAGRRNRNSYLVKIVGGFCLINAILCVIITVTTTVLHMNRLQSLRECVFTQKTQTCTCYSVVLDSAADRGDEGMRYVFNSTPDCEVIHGALYSCLRAMFGLSVIGILVCIFSCMLVYQLLSHEKKKMYWEQLELRCRYLSRQQRTQHCSCCEECRHPSPSNPELFPWELDDRFWSPRVGNLYSPNPGAHEVALAARRPGWSWRRLPWSRAATVASETTTSCIPNQHSLRQATGSPDSQYGFSSRAPTSSPTPGVATPFATDASQGFYMWGPPPPYSSPCRQPALLNLLRHRSPQRVAHSCHQGRQCRPNNRTPEQCSSPVKPDNTDEERRSRLRKPRADEASNYVNTSEGELMCEDASSTSAPLRKTKKLKREDEESDRLRSSLMRGSSHEESEGYEDLQPCHTPERQRCPCQPSPRAAGVANRAFCEPTESEVYFADVSSCCNVSVRNDSFIYDEATEPSTLVQVSLKQCRLPHRAHGDHSHGHSEELRTLHDEPGRYRDDSLHRHSAESRQDENLLKSNCFSYQCLSASAVGFLDEKKAGYKRDDDFKPAWVDEDASMECSSNSATPVTDTTFMSPATPDSPSFYVLESPGEVSGEKPRDFLAPDAQYESMPPTPRPREELNANDGEKPTPMRRRLNLNLNPPQPSPRDNSNINTTKPAPSARENLNLNAAKPAPNIRDNLNLNATKPLPNIRDNLNLNATQPCPNSRDNLNLNVTKPPADSVNGNPTPASPSVREILQNFENARQGLDSFEAEEESETSPRRHPARNKDTKRKESEGNSARSVNV